MGKKYGLNFSWKRASGLSAAKGKISRKLGVPLTRSGRQRKVGKAMGCCVPLLVGVALATSGVAFAHKGRLDTNGGHRDTKNGGYHYHGGASSSGAVSTSRGRATDGTPPSIGGRPIFGAVPVNGKNFSRPAPPKPYVRRGPARAKGGWADQENVPPETEEVPAPEPPGMEVEVYRAGEQKGFHWQKACFLISGHETTSLTLEEAKEGELIECGLCEYIPPAMEAEDPPEASPTPKAFPERLHPNRKRLPRREWRQERE